MAVVVIVIAVTFIAGLILGAVLLVSVASIREDRRPRLSRDAPDRIAAAGRYVTRLDIRRNSDFYGQSRREAARRAAGPRAGQRRTDERRTAGDDTAAHLDGTGGADDGRPADEPVPAAARWRAGYRWPPLDPWK